MTKKTNLFAKAKKTAPKKTAKKDEKIIVTVPGKEFAADIAKFNSLKIEIKQLEADMAMKHAIIKTIGIEKFVGLVETKKINVGSFILASEKNDRVMILPTKKYIKITEKDAETLTETYGEDIVEENTKYAFNTKILMDNMEAISDLIQTSDDISESDKDNLIEAVTTHTVAKDALDKVYPLAQESENTVEEVIEDLQPVFQVKNA